MKSQLLRNNDKIPHYTDDNFSTHDFRLCIPLTIFHSASDIVHEISHAGLHFVRKNSSQYFSIP